MMKLKDFKVVVILFLSFQTFAQSKITGIVTNADNGQPIAKVKVYDKATGLKAITNASGYYEFETIKNSLVLVFFSYEFQVAEIPITVSETNTVNMALKQMSINLSEVEVTARKAKLFELSRLNDIEETAIYAGKKTEVVLVEQSMANLASNNARQLYSQVAGLNIYQNDDAGLQLNIGGRGLDPNRTANFNTRQNGYDISADVLGYPESYYTPASEGLEQIQIVRGAASLQYGTQFGGLINFKIKSPNTNKSIELVTRNTLGSFGLYTNFTSLSGTKNKFSYYSYFNYKKGDGFRPNSEFESKNVFAHLGYQFNNKTKLTGDLTYMRYLAKQGGGLTDNMFYANPYQSNRSRNWFQIDWLLYNVKLDHKFSEQTHFTFNFFGLNASRDALGFRSNRVDQIDPETERDLIKGDFKNVGFETRLLSKYKMGKKHAVFLVGGKFYKSNNKQQQGPGSDGSDADFNFYTDQFPYYLSQAKFYLPNLNVAVFGENIVYVNEKLSVTPGFRFEYIKTQSNGYYKNINTDAAGNVIFDETIDDNRNFDRAFVLFGLGVSYKPVGSLEFYGNVSQNYRSVTFSDININNIAFEINPAITDEKGFTVDAGLRGHFKNVVSYDLGAFALFYRDRIGFKPIRTTQGVKSERGNIGNAVMYGIESLFDFNLKKIIGLTKDFGFNGFINTSFINSEYTSSEALGVEGNNVEFVPHVNLKTGLKFRYKDFSSNIQYMFLSQQFTDATNSVVANISGIMGEIPSYDILDASIAYKYKYFKLETGVNNVLDTAYFTRRATGYPGPGIIPSAPRNWYVTLQIKL